MTTGQSLLTLGALVLLSTVIFNNQRRVAGVDDSLAQDRYRLEALSLLTAHLEKASQYYFDEVTTDTSSAKTLANFSDPAALGLEANDNGVIDDFDDFNNYTLADTGASGVAYRLRFTVDYVTAAGESFVHSDARQYLKRMRVFITDDYDPPMIFRIRNGQPVKDTLSVEWVNGYWFYN